MTGLQETQRICKNKSIKHAPDTIAECLRRIQRHSMDLADTGPANILQVAQHNLPARPGPGQAISFPIENIMVADGVILLIPVYRLIYAHVPSVPATNQGWDSALLAKSALGITIAAHAAMFAEQSLVDIYISKDKLVADLKEDKLSCPKDILCTADTCRGQKEDENISGQTPMSPMCTEVSRISHLALFPTSLTLPLPTTDSELRVRLPTSSISPRLQSVVRVHRRAVRMDGTPHPAVQHGRVKLPMSRQFHYLR
jgi:hypothetical protein